MVLEASPVAVSFNVPEIVLAETLTSQAETLSAITVLMTEPIIAVDDG